MWALVWWILGTHAPQAPTVALYSSQQRCEAERKFIEEHVKVLKANGVTSTLACVEATQMDEAQSQFLPYYQSAPYVTH